MISNEYCDPLILYLLILRMSKEATEKLSLQVRYQEVSQIR